MMTNWWPPGTDLRYQNRFASSHFTAPGKFTAPASAKTAAPSRFFDVKNFGAAADGKTLDTEAIGRAVDACHAAGGGVVYLAGGPYLSGTGVALMLDKSSKI